jgi:uncharacterized membrane protein YhaH (DUF805 family)
MNNRLQDVASGRGDKTGRGWFSGRANRKEYWLFVGPLFGLVIGLGIFGMTALSLVASVPILFFWIRRLHDLGRTGWWAPGINAFTNALAFGLGLAIPGGVGALLGLLVYVAAIITLGSLPGQPRTNEFGSPSGKQPDLVETFS